MRLPRVRFMVRGIMVMVAILAISIGGMQTWMRRVRFRNWAVSHAHQTQMLSESVAQGEAQIARARDRLIELRTGPENNGGYSINDRKVSFAEFIVSEERHIAQMVESQDYNRAFLDYFSALKGKYERAARVPWNSVEPDPSPPGPLDTPAGPLVPGP